MKSNSTYFGVIKLSCLGGLYSPILQGTSNGGGYFLSNTISFVNLGPGLKFVTFYVTSFC